MKKKTTTKSVGGISTVMAQDCGQDLLTTTRKGMDQGKEKENMFTQETVWVL